MTGAKRAKRHASSTPVAPADTLAGALALHQSGDLAGAEAAYRACLKAQPDNADAWNNLGLLLHGQGRSAEAAECLQQATVHAPANPRGFANLGVVLRALGRLDEAAAAQRGALKIRPDFAQAHNNLGNLLHAAEDYRAAEEHFRQACTYDASVFEHHFMLGKCLLELRDFEGALAALQRGQNLAPQNADIRGTIARVWMDRLRLPEALAAYDEGMAMRPDYEPLRYNRGLARLLNGDLAGGFADYESRWQVPEFPSKRLASPQPLWDGAALPTGTLLLHAEQGLGDSLQMLRYLPQVAERVGQVWLLVQTPLAGLVDLPSNVRLLTDGQPLPAHDAVCPLLSLPHLLHTDILHVPTPIPYIQLDPAIGERWRQRLAVLCPDKRFKVGLTWAGNPAHRNDANRSLPFDLLKPLLALPDIDFIALQVGSGRETLGEHPELHDLGPELKDFSDTAGVLETLDLLITVDTSIAHLAGALGLPVWLLVPQVPDWRWLLGRDDSPWYPSLSLFRQSGHQQWPQVIGAVCQRLQAVQADAGAPASPAGLATEAGRVLLETGQFADAARQFWHALRLRPTHSRALSGLSVVAWRHNRPAAALAFGARACRLDPDNPENWSNQGAFLKANADHLQALAHFDEAVQRFPGNTSLLYNRGLARLLNGDLEGGFADYESRWQVPDFPSKRLASPQPLWDGKPLPAGTLLLHAEQGLGDSLQMLRYLPQVAERVGQVWLLLQPSLAGLVELPANVRLLADGQAIPAHDAVCPLLSLPHLLHTDLQNIPLAIPYLRLDPAIAARWRQRIAVLCPGKRLKVGLTWAGSPTHRNDANRSLLLAQLKPLLALPNIDFVGLQIGSGREALGAYPEIHDLGPELKSFSDTAGVLEALDLLITVDTSIAHLAGGMGLPVWLLLPQVPDWRWLLDRDDSPWYPSLSLFRQSGHRQWPEVIAALGQRLQSLLGDVGAPGSPAENATEAGRARLEAGQFDDAARQFWQALRLRPTHSRALSGLSVVAWRQKRPAAALAFGARACRLAPENPENWSNQGAFLKAGERYEEALACQQEALKCTPDHPMALSNLSNVLGKLERWEAARAPAERALQLAPDVADFHYNAGIVFKELAEFERALTHFREAQRLQAGGHVKARLHEALVLLLTGEFKAGWDAYESRWAQPDCKEKRSFTCPLWQGEALDGKTLLLYSEQGLGDSFQFMRYAPLAAERGGRVLLVVQPEVEALARRMPGKHEVFASGAPLPDYDFQCPLLSLPRVFGTRLDSVPVNVPYLRTDPERVEHWKTQLEARSQGAKKLRVGLVWAGRPTHGNDANRSLSLSHFAPLLADPGMDWVALQKGPSALAAAVSEAAHSLFVLDASLRDFDDTAAVLSHLDVLVTVDTSVAHLAGALNIPTLVLLPKLPDWRWLWQRSDSPWYPSVTLLRQAERGAWSTVIAQLKEKLHELARLKG